MIMAMIQMIMKDNKDIPVDDHLCSNKADRTSSSSKADIRSREETSKSTSVFKANSIGSTLGYRDRVSSLVDTYSTHIVSVAYVYKELSQFNEVLQPKLKFLNKIAHQHIFLLLI